MLLSVLIISCITYFIVNHGISRIVILYGRRKFATMILTGMVLKFDLIYPITPFEMVEMSGIGVLYQALLKYDSKSKVSLLLYQLVCF